MNKFNIKGNKMKTELNKLTERKLLKYFKENGFGELSLIEKPSKSIQLAAIEENINNCFKLQSISEFVLRTIVEKNDSVFVELLKGGVKPSYKTLVKAVSINGNILVYAIKNGIEVNDELIKLALVNTPSVINSIKNPSIEVQVRYLELVGTDSRNTKITIESKIVLWLNNHPTFKSILEKIFLVDKNESNWETQELR